MTQRKKIGKNAEKTVKIGKNRKNSENRIFLRIWGKGMVFLDRFLRMTLPKMWQQSMPGMIRRLFPIYYEPPRSYKLVGGFSVYMKPTKRHPNKMLLLVHTIPYHNITLPYLILPYLTLPYIALPYLTLHYLTLPYLTLHYNTLYTLHIIHNI